MSSEQWTGTKGRRRPPADGCALAAGTARHLARRPAASVLRRALLWMLWIGIVVGSGQPLPVAWSQPEDALLRERRAQRRAAMRQAVSASAEDRIAGDKSAGADAALFGLLVIPVDFADTRLPDGWDPTIALGPRLFPPTGETLASYFRTASTGRVEMRITLAPLVRLSGQRTDYSDIDWGGDQVANSQAMATEALVDIRDRGLAFRTLDMDGPDRLPGTADDDGEVDGVLILHAGVGNENRVAPEGLIEALQFYLAEPVLDDGVQASAYAVASMHSGLGIWAHETSHLLGLNDRYDLDLGVQTVDGGEGDLAAAGGLGRFSLMGAGAWGSGGGHGPALLDAYSCLQLGWCDLVNWRGASTTADTLRPAVAGGAVWRLWTRGQVGPEYYLLETRGAAAAAPFDATLPAEQLLIYHVDETLADGEASPGIYPDRHLRVRLVEADADGGLATGLDLGRTEDLFPGALQVSTFGPATTPSSDGYTAPSEIALTSIVPVAGGVALLGSDTDGYGAAVTMAFSAAADTQLVLRVDETGWPFVSASCRVEITSQPAHGHFAAGETSATVELARDTNGYWINAAPVLWRPDPDTPAGARTFFEVQVDAEVTAGSWRGPREDRSWLWDTNAAVLDFAGIWPGDWSVSYPTTIQSTSWFRWPAGTGLTADGTPVLACTGENFASGLAWPDVHYENEGEVTLTSGLLGAELQAVRIVHSIDSQTLRGATAADGGTIEWILPDGSSTSAVITDGYPEAFSPRVAHALHDRGAFAGADSVLRDGRPDWRVDLVEMPPGQGPFQLRLHFASDEIWRARGWFVARLDPLVDEAPASAFPLAWLPEAVGGATLVWSWPWEIASSFRVEARLAPEAAWEQIWEGWPDAGQDGYAFGLGGGSGALAGLPADPGARVALRVVALTELGDVRSRPVVYYGDGGAKALPALGQPYPNPARGEVKLRVNAAAGGGDWLGLYDLRGRLVRRWQLYAGDHLLSWDGTDAQGRTVAAGAYVFRLEAASGPATRKVMWLR